MSQVIFEKSTMTITNYIGELTNPEEVLVGIAGQSILLSRDEVNELQFVLDQHLHDVKMSIQATDDQEAERCIEARQY